MWNCCCILVKLDSEINADELRSLHPACSRISRIGATAKIILRVLTLIQTSIYPTSYTSNYALISREAPTIYALIGGEGCTTKCTKDLIK